MRSRFLRGGRGKVSRTDFNPMNGGFDSHPPRHSLDLACVCPPGLLRLDYHKPLKVGVFCPACLLITLRDEAEGHRFLDLYEEDEAVRQGVLYALHRHLEWYVHEVNAGLEAPRLSKEMETLPFD